MEWYVGVLKKYAVFTGRARRKEYWMFVLFNILILIGLGIVEGILGLSAQGRGGPLVLVYRLAVLVPAIAVGIRRMHDIGKSGWWLLVPILNIVYLATAGQTSANDYGPDPKAGTT